MQKAVQKSVMLFKSIFFSFLLNLSEGVGCDNKKGTAADSSKQGCQTPLIETSRSKAKKWRAGDRKTEEVRSTIRDLNVQLTRERVKAFQGHLLFVNSVKSPGSLHLVRLFVRHLGCLELLWSAFLVHRQTFLNCEVLFYSPVTFL